MRATAVAALRRRLSGRRSASAASPPSPSPSPPRTFAAAASRAEKGAEQLNSIDPGFDSGLKWALAGRGVIVKDKAYYNLETSELQKNGGRTLEHIPDVPLLVRGISVGDESKISRAQFSKLLKQVTSHLSSVPNIFVQDGAISSSPQCDAKVRLISDTPSAVLSLSKILWKVNSRAIAHDPCPLTVYIAGSVSPTAGEIIGSGAKGSNGFAVADIERSSLVICGRGYASATATKDALIALAAPILSSRGGVPISARLLSYGDSMVMLFAQEDTISGSSDLRSSLISTNVGVVLSSGGAAALLRSRDSAASLQLKKPDSVVFITADSTGVFPAVSKLTPGQAAYQFLAGFSNGKFMPTYSKAPLPFGPLELAEALYLQLKGNEIPSFLINFAASRNNSGKIDDEELFHYI